jgi:hypothetical protein
MSEILSKPEQLRLLRDIAFELNEHSKIDRLAIIAAFAAIIGQISEKNLINLLNYAQLNGPKDRDMVYPLIKYYITNNIINLKDNKKGLYKELNDIKIRLRPSDREVALLVRENIKRMRNRYLTNGV